MESQPQNELLSTLGKAVTARRKKQGLSQEHAAELCGLHRTYISDIENGKRNLSLAAFIRLAKGLALSPSELLELAESEEKTSKANRPASSD